jgi:glutaminyl-peptide cyclotransferase
MSKTTNKPAHHPTAQKVFLIVVIAASCAVGAYLLLEHPQANGKAEQPVSSPKLADIPFNGARAYEYLKDLCQLGPRPSGSPGMEEQQKLLVDHFTKLGGEVELQRFEVAHPEHPTTPPAVPMANIIVHWNPKSKERILLCAHYDTLPVPFRDPVNPKGTFVGANDNAGGVAILMELARDMPKLKSKYGVDFALFDGEEFMFHPDGRFFLGSEYFAQKYADSKLPYRYRWAVLLDMVADKDLEIHEEGNSLSWPDSKPLVEQIWSVAKKLGVVEFKANTKYDVRDDHVMLHDVGKIPSIDIIDFDYPAWHTEQDKPEQCSALSLAKVGWVLSQWLKEAE